jgi:selT/selW/selH-like putative selenoprotein
VPLASPGRVDGAGARTTFSTDIGEIALMPGTGGVFAIRIGDDAVWSPAEKGRFSEIKELKQIVRDRIVPVKDLGHSEIGRTIIQREAEG